jgi:hypothetical protein
VEYNNKVEYTFLAFASLLLEEQSIKSGSDTHAMGAIV